MLVGKTIKAHFCKNECPFIAVLCWAIAFFKWDGTNVVALPNFCNKLAGGEQSQGAERFLVSSNVWTPMGSRCWQHMCCPAVFHGPHLHASTLEGKTAGCWHVHRRFCVVGVSLGILPRKLVDEQLFQQQNPTPLPLHQGGGSSSIARGPSAWWREQRCYHHWGQCSWTCWSLPANQVSSDRM